MVTEEKIRKGDVVKVRHGALNNVPMMVVKDLRFKKIDKEDKEVLVGVVCFWFTEGMVYQEAVFSHRDLKTEIANKEDLYGKAFYL